MKFILFHPFDAGKWFVLGFTAWLAYLFEGGGSGSGGGGGNSGSSEPFENGDFTWGEAQETVMGWVETARQWMADNPGIVTLIVVAVIVLILVFFVLFWVHCRGKFMFLDNIIWNRALVSHPWRTYKRQGNSLFWWSTIYGFVVLFLLLGEIAGLAFYVFSVFEGGGEWNATATATTIAGGIAIFLLFLILAYISMVLEDFVTPLMYRDYLTTTQAWGKFLQLQNRHIFRFIGYALVKMLLMLLIGIGVLIFGVGTCCIGLIIIAIPYLGTVLMLPVYVFTRALGPEYLAQFGEEYDLFGLEER